jgi:DNA mismatch repair protein MutL
MRHPSQSLVCRIAFISKVPFPELEAGLAPEPGFWWYKPPMGKVRVLDPVVAERIAAGEVIERPASVVKELVENSIDAGATEVQVRLEAGGRSLIEVQDNGQGMDPEDLKLAIRRHATSKLQQFEDLETLSTLGFRGEALPSVAAVTELTITSRAKGSKTAYELIAPPESSGRAPETRPATHGHFLGAEHGTLLQARGLFAQMPARLKFLKSQSAEVAQVREWIERLALSHPEIGFTLISDERTLLRLKPQTVEERIRAVLGEGEDYPLIETTLIGEASGKAYWLQGLSQPSTRKLIQIVNGRAIRDRFLQQAILNPFRQALLPGQFPALALFLELDPSRVDVNVHPTKTEVRFLESSRVYRAVTQAMEHLVAKNGAPAYAAGQASPFALEVPRIETPTLPEGMGSEWKFRPGPELFTRPQWAASENSSTSLEQAGSSGLPILEETPAPQIPTHPFSPHLYIGVFFQTYLAYDLGQELALIDQHAAHERVRYEKLKKRVLDRAQGELSIQTLLIPESAPFPAEKRSDLESRLNWLAQLGFDAEIFGESAVLFRSVPSEWGIGNLRVRLKALIDRVLEAEEAPALLDERLFEKLASEACHSAIRAGDRLEKIQALELVEQLFACQHPWNCPHGRPTVVRIPRARFEEWFQRRVPH